MTIAPPSAVDTSPLRPGRYDAGLRAEFVRAAPLSRIEPACWLLLAAAAVCGGLSVFGWRDALLALLALPPLLFALWPQDERTPTRLPVALAVAASLLPLAFLIPLPASWVLQLPGRAELLQPAVAELGAARWLPLSLAPDATWQAWLKTIPPLALFVAALRMSDAARRRLLFALLLLALSQALWALLQLPAGADERLYLYGTDGASRGAGAFANRSHLAGLLALVLPTVAMLALNAGETRAALPQRIAIAAGALLLVAAMLATRSRAGACLLALELAALALWSLRRQRARTVAFAVAAAVAAALLILPSAGPQLLQGFALDVADGRAALLQRSLVAAMTFFPLGSGPGSFAGVFATFDTTATLDTVFVNHAHDEPVQLLFELGIAGVALFAGALTATATVLARHAADGLRWACALGVAAALLHSLVDYPLRVPLPALVCAALAACALSPRRRM
jgi:hypothetical protein